MNETYKRLIKDSLLITSTLAGLVAISLFGFKKSVKESVIEQQQGICPVCGKPLSGMCEAHHRVPQILGGNNGSLNCVIVHGDKRGIDCHESLDQAALGRGRIFLSKKDNAVPISQVPKELFRNEAERQKALKRFIRNND